MNRYSDLPPRIRREPRRLRSVIALTAVMMGCPIAMGCQTLRPPEFADAGVENNDAVRNNDSVEGRLVSDRRPTDRVVNDVRQAARWMTGREVENIDRAKKLYQRADTLFREAAQGEIVENRSKYRTAAKTFGRAAEAAEGKGLAQDALFMQAESLFFADRLMEATDVYQRLQRDYPRNRHDDRIAARLFSIQRYWGDAAKAEGSAWYKLNLFDRSRPVTDAEGHAIRVLDQIRYDNPTGKLADDATMAAAAEFIAQGKFEEADEFLTDLRVTFPDSEHLFLAHMMGIQCKLAIYSGPSYSGLVLDEAAELITKTRKRFPNQSNQPQYAEMLARASKMVEFKRAEKYFERAEYRRKRREYGAAANWYRRIIDEFPRTPQAETAGPILETIMPRAAVPTPRMNWMTKIFPNQTTNNPLEVIAEGPPRQTAADVIRR